jgi:hypothetical protein|tara:strand:+ start:136 stop:483 length:348 start_codon:yes stop_codon:yes gene_type:complete
MNVGPVNTSIPVASTAEGAVVGEATATGDSNAGSNQAMANIPASKEEAREFGGAPEPLKQMPTSDFLSLRENFGSESVMDKLAKIFETILALRILEETIENVSKSIDDQSSDKED